MRYSRLCLSRHICVIARYSCQKPAVTLQRSDQRKASSPMGYAIPYMFMFGGIG